MITAARQGSGLVLGAFKERSRALRRQFLPGAASCVELLPRTEEEAPPSIPSGTAIYPGWSGRNSPILRERLPVSSLAGPAAGVERVLRGRLQHGGCIGEPTLAALRTQRDRVW